jgi:hypothetical protein
MRITRRPQRNERGIRLILGQGSITRLNQTYVMLGAGLVGMTYDRQLAINACREELLATKRKLEKLLNYTDPPTCTVQGVCTTKPETT